MHFVRRELCGVALTVLAAEHSFFPGTLIDPAFSQGDEIAETLVVGELEMQYFVVGGAQ